MIHFRKTTAGPSAEVLPRPLSAEMDFALDAAVGKWLKDCNIVGNIVRGCEYRLEKLVCALALETPPNNPARIRLATAISTPTFVYDMTQQLADVLVSRRDWLFERFTLKLFKEVLGLMVAGEYETARTSYRGLGLPLVYPVAAGDQPEVMTLPVPVLPPQPLTGATPVVLAVPFVLVSDDAGALASPMEVEVDSVPVAPAPSRPQKRKAVGDLSERRRKVGGAPPAGPDSEADTETLRTLTDFVEAAFTLPPVSLDLLSTLMQDLSSSAATASAMSVPTETSLQPPPVPRSLRGRITLSPPSLPPQPTAVGNFFCGVMRHLVFGICDPINYQSYLVELYRRLESNPPDWASSMTPAEIEPFLFPLRLLIRMDENSRSTYVNTYVAALLGFSRFHRWPDATSFQLPPVGSAEQPAAVRKFLDATMQHLLFGICDPSKYELHLKVLCSSLESYYALDDRSRLEPFLSPLRRLMGKDVASRSICVNMHVAVLHGFPRIYLGLVS